MVRGGIVGSGVDKGGLSCRDHDEAHLLRTLGENWGLEQR